MYSRTVIYLSFHSSRHKSGELKEEYQRLSRHVNRGKNQRDVGPFPAGHCGFFCWQRTHHDPVGSFRVPKIAFWSKKSGK
jgi:hypothetical protein